MTDIEQKALALVNEVRRERGYVAGCEIHRDGHIWNEALCRAIERHEAFRQEVSDAVEQRFNHNRAVYGRLERFILPKPDPLVEAFKETQDVGDRDFDNWATQFRAAIEKRGGKIVWGEG